jgi:hypothetical protein
MMVAEAGILVGAPLATVREAVLDPDSYTKYETKVGAVEVRERYDGGLLALIHGNLGPFRSAILARYTVRGDDVDLQMLEGRLRAFHAVFRLAPLDGGTWLVHREEYDFGYGPLGPLLDRALHRWATGTVQAEVRALRRAAEGRVAAASGAPVADGPVTEAPKPDAPVTAGRAMTGPPSESPAPNRQRED